jgi:acetyl esterase/lipase
MTASLHLTLLSLEIPPVVMSSLLQQIADRSNENAGNLALTTCYEIMQRKLPMPGALIMLSPWLDLTRSTSGNSPNQPTDWLTTFDSEECRVGAIEMYMGTTIKSAQDPRVSPM